MANGGEESQSQHHRHIEQAANASNLRLGAMLDIVFNAPTVTG
jgi:hypothetical protein